MSLRDFLLDNNVWWDIFDVWFVVLPLAAGILTLAARSRQPPCSPSASPWRYAAQWTGEALYSTDSLSYPALRGAGIAVLGAGAVIGALAPAPESEDIARSCLRGSSSPAWSCWGERSPSAAVAFNV